MINEETNAEDACTTLATKAIKVEYIWEAARDMGLPVAIWRLPENRGLRLIVSERVLVQDGFPDLEKLEGGFILAPFQNSPESKVFFLEGNFSVSWIPGTPEVSIDTAPSRERMGFAEALLAKAGELQKLGKPVGDGENNTLEALHNESIKDRFLRIVQLGAEAVRAGDLFKVVLSRTKEFQVSKDYSFKSAFLQLEAAYPSAFVSMVSLPDFDEIWLGASPEILVEVKQQRFFRTVALAGTQSAKDCNGAVKPKFKVLWSEKEIEEQAIVSRYIIECFKRIRLREYVETGPKSSKAGNLYHLKSDFEVDISSVNFPELGSVMLKLLHPTSAVCGMPKESALALIASLEGYDRSFYSGYWGPVNMDGDTNLFVNLRTLRVRNQVMTLFAGAGITSDSDPEAEWDETELKCDTLLGVIDPAVSSGHQS